MNKFKVLNYKQHNMTQAHTHTHTHIIKKKNRERPEETIFQERHTNGQLVYKKSCPISLIIREMQIQTTMRYHLTPSTVASIKKTINIMHW